MASSTRTRGTRGRRHCCGCRVLVTLVLVTLVCATPVLAKKKPKLPDPIDITNFALGAEYAQWLVGPIVRIASVEERTRFLSLTSDGEAKAFIESFWERRGPNLAIPPSGPRHTFETRAEEADRLFKEGAKAGRRSDRGTIHVLHGAPASIEYASSPTQGGAPIEIWIYPKKAEPGLDGRKPKVRYGFRDVEGVTVFFPLSAARSLRRTPDRSRRPPG